jgi:hypothetical protein
MRVPLSTIGSRGDVQPLVALALAFRAVGLAVPFAWDRVTWMPVPFETVRQLALALPEAEEGTSYGTPAFKIRGKLFARLWEDGETLVLKISFDAREILMKADPETFYITDHYRGYPTVLVRLPRIEPDQLREVLEEAWRFNAPKRLAAAR